MRLYVSTSNKDKVKEILAKLGSEFELITKAQAGFADFDVEENGTSLEENARIKAFSLYEKGLSPVFADDTGLYVEALNGAPGIYAARYAGENCSYKDNVEKILREMSEFSDIDQRKAYFETVICYIDEEGKDYYIHGRMDGHITKEVMGDGGFGYDPVFVPQGYDKSFSQLGLDVKNEISHRGKALDNFREFLKER